MLEYTFDQSLIWHVIFHPGRRLWSRTYQHVSLAGFSNDTWLHLDLQRSGVHVASIYHHEEVEDYLTFLLAHYGVLRFGPSRPGPSRQFFRPLTCVSFVKHVLGVQSSALRPDALFRDLCRMKGIEVLNEGESPCGNPRAATAAHQG